MYDSHPLFVAPLVLNHGGGIERGKSGVMTIAHGDLVYGPSADVYA